MSGTLGWHSEGKQLNLVEVGFRKESEAPGVAQLVKNLPAMQETKETQVQSLCWEDPLEEGHDNPLQHYCLENPMDRGSWWATVHRVAKNQTRLKRLSTCPKGRRKRESQRRQA